MLRWTILLSSFALWVLVLCLVYDQYGTKPPSPEALQNREALDAIFGELAPKTSRWQVFINLKSLAGTQPAHSPFKNPYLQEELRRQLEFEIGKAYFHGAEMGSIEIGTMEAQIRLQGATRAEETVLMQAKLPSGLAPELMSMFGQIRYRMTANYSIDRGLEDFTSTFSIGSISRIVRRGYREENALKLQTFVYKGKDLIGQERMQIPVRGASAPSLGFLPFTFRPDVNLGKKWELAMLSTTSSSENPMVSVTARVIGKESIRFHGGEVQAFIAELEQEHFKARACYRPDGLVLIERGMLAELLEITLIRELDAPLQMIGNERFERDNDD